jgi:uncharacterized membrane protein YbhN (UPF0104 family)
MPRARIAHDAGGQDRIERGLKYAWERTSKRHLALAIIMFAPVLAMQSLRLKVMLSAQDIHITWWESLKLSVGGNFLNFVFLLGTTAGDVFKAYYTAQHTEHKTEAVATVFIDRFMGLAGLLIVAGAMSFLGSGGALLHNLGFFAVAMLAAMAVGAWVFALPWAARILALPKLSRWPAVAHLRRIHQSVARLVQRKPVLFSALGLAALLQFVAVGAGVMSAYALHMDFGGDRWRDYFVYIGAGHLVAAIPITPQGLGTMELAYQQFFLGKYGTLAQLLCLALWVRLLQLFWALPGALVTLLGAHRPTAAQLDEVADATVQPSG